MKYAKWTIGIVAAVALAALLWVGCTPTTSSLLVENKDVTRVEFKAEVGKIVAEQKAMEAKIEAGDTDLDAQEARNAEALQTALDVAGSAVNTVLTGKATATGMVGLGIMGGLTGLWTAARRKAKNGDKVGGIVVQAVDIMRKNPEMQKALEDALKIVLVKSGMSEAEYTAAIAKLKAEAAAA